jgi:hypothetical protein
MASATLVWFLVFEDDGVGDVIEIDRVICLDVTPSLFPAFIERVRCLRLGLPLPVLVIEDPLLFVRPVKVLVFRFRWNFAVPPELS